MPVPPASKYQWGGRGRAWAGGREKGKIVSSLQSKNEQRAKSVHFQHGPEGARTAYFQDQGGRKRAD